MDAQAPSLIDGHSAIRIGVGREARWAVWRSDGPEEAGEFVGFVTRPLPSESSIHHGLLWVSQDMWLSVARFYLADWGLDVVTCWGNTGQMCRLGSTCLPGGIQVAFQLPKDPRGEK